MKCTVLNKLSRQIIGSTIKIWFKQNLILQKQAYFNLDLGTLLLVHVQRGGWKHHERQHASHDPY